MSVDKQYDNEDMEFYIQQKTRHPKSKDTTNENQSPQKDTMKDKKTNKKGWN